MISLNDTAITRDAKSKIRVIRISCNWSEKLNAYIIERSSGLLDGKQIVAPIITIDRGKVKRTIDQQAELQYNSELKKYLDKGYKNIKDLGINDLTLQAAEEALPSNNTDQNGAVKPQLCKILDKTNKKLTDKQWLGSYKHDGVRMLLFMRDGEVHTASRGGQDYDIPATYIRNDPYVIKLFKENEGLILDGELYRHGWNLQTLSGLSRREELTEEHKELVFHCYDIVDLQTPFKFRAARLGKFDEERPDNSRIIFVEHRPVKGLDQIMLMHNEAVANGYEGLVIRDPEKEYKCGARDNRMLKIKEFSDSEFKILGLVEGLRDEDMCFLMETEDGTQFKAKPIGDRAQKQWYRDHLDEIIGKMGTVKYFGMTNSEHPVPNLPSFRTVRYDL